MPNLWTSPDDLNQFIKFPLSEAGKDYQLDYEIEELFEEEGDESE